MRKSAIVINPPFDWKNNLWTLVDVTKPVPGYIVIGPCWYICVDGNPIQALFYRKTAQRNTSKNLVDYMLSTETYKAFGNLSAVFLELSYSPNPYV